MTWRNIVKYANGHTLTYKHNNSEGDAKGWNESLAQSSVFGKVESVHLEHVADGPYDYSGKVTPIQTVYNSP